MPLRPLRGGVGNTRHTELLAAFVSRESVRELVSVSSPAVPVLLKAVPEGLHAVA